MTDVNLDELTRPQLQKLASQQYNITLTPSMTADDIRLLIKAKQKKGDVAKLSEFVGDRPEPGWARIMIHRDPNPQASNRPVYVGANGYRITIPRGVEVDVPLKVVGVLNKAKQGALKENKSVARGDPNRYVWEESHTYPFSIIDHVDGPDPRPGNERNNTAKKIMKQKFLAKYGFYPKGNQLREAITSGELEGVAITT